MCLVPQICCEQARVNRACCWLLVHQAKSQAQSTRARTGTVPDRHAMAVPASCKGSVLGSMNTAGYAAKKGTPRANEPPVRLFVPASLKATVHEVTPPATYCAHDTMRLLKSGSRPGMVQVRMWLAGSKHAGGSEDVCGLHIFHVRHARLGKQRMHNLGFSGFFRKKRRRR